VVTLKRCDQLQAEADRSVPFGPTTHIRRIQMRYAPPPQFAFVGAAGWFPLCA
jgi:hypothetical protein